MCIGVCPQCVSPPSAGQHELEEAQQCVARLETQSHRDGDQLSKLEGEMDVLREKLECEMTQRQSVEEEIRQLKLASRGDDSTDSQQSQAGDDMSELRAELVTRDKQLETLQQSTSELEEEVEGLKDKVRQLQVEKDKALSDLITLRKSHRNIERCVCAPVCVL